jgi:hypothetical protein
LKRFDNTEGEIYLISLDTFMIMSVVGLSLGMVFFLLNPSFKSGGLEAAGAGCFYKNLPMEIYDSMKDDVLNDDEIIKIDGFSNWIIENDKIEFSVNTFVDTADINNSKFSIQLTYNPQEDEKESLKESEYKYFILNNTVLKVLKDFKMELIK